MAVIEVADRNADLLRYLGDLELYPGTEIKVLRVEPYDGPFVIKIGDREVIIGRAAAEEVRVARKETVE